MAADPTSPPPRPFDVGTVEHLIGLMAKHDLAEIALQEGEHRIRLRKAVPPPVFAAPVHHHPAPAPQTAGLNPAARPDAPPPAGPTLTEIKSEMVGTFFSRPKPDKPDYVSAGSAVNPATVICLIEAMKIFNEVPAGVTGTVAEVCVKNGDFVEFGTVLFRVNPS